jgi:hypothetical protein
MDVKDILPDVQSAVNKVESTAMGCSPFYAMHGWEAIDNVETECGIDKPLTTSNKKLLEEVVTSNKLRMELLKNARELASKETKHRFDGGIVNIPQFSVGDLVLLSTHDHKLSSQTSRKDKVLFEGPYYILHVDRFQAALKDVKGEILPDMHSLRKLKKIESYKQSFPVDLANKSTDPVISIYASEKTRTIDGKLQHLCYPKDREGSIERKCGFWLDDAVWSKHSVQEEEI